MVMSTTHEKRRLKLKLPGKDETKLVQLPDAIPCSYCKKTNHTTEEHRKCAICGNPYHHKNYCDAISCRACGLTDHIDWRYCTYESCDVCGEDGHSSVVCKRASGKHCTICDGTNHTAEEHRPCRYCEGKHKGGYCPSARCKTCGERGHFYYVCELREFVVEN